MKPDRREAWLRELISTISGRSALETGTDEDLGEAVGLDSLGRLEVLAAVEDEFVEDEFDILFDDGALTTATTISKILRAIQDKTPQLREEEA
ncbi:acyl carrier protein [Tropicimonas aquimaris]|uniref:Acyl carrier protein n=1 Tax=Tropicimonas aquimaris TaxID=914152 RepID=A0ABW3ITP6_9RHOB